MNKKYTLKTLPASVVIYTLFIFTMIGILVLLLFGVGRGIDVRNDILSVGISLLVGNALMWFYAVRNHSKIMQSIGKYRVV